MERGFGGSSSSSRTRAVGLAKLGLSQSRLYSSSGLVLGFHQVQWILGLVKSIIWVLIG